MTHFLRTLALVLILVAGGQSARACCAALGDASATGSTASVYAVAGYRAPTAAPGLDISVNTAGGLELVTVEPGSGSGIRIVLTDAEGNILRTRAAEGEVLLQFDSFPAGTYRVSVLDRAGELMAQQTVVKR